MIITPNHEQKDIKWLEQEYPDLYGWLDDMASYLCIEALADIKDFGDGIRITLYGINMTSFVKASGGRGCDG